MPALRTNVCIVGGGASGLLLGWLLGLHGIDYVILERRSRRHVESRVRAGLLEQGTVELLRDAGAAHRLDVQGLRHEGFWFHTDEQVFRLDFAALTGRSVWMYGQQEIVKDLIALHVARNSPLHFDVQSVRIIETARGGCEVAGELGGRELVVRSDFIAGCDGSHGVSRTAMLRKGAVAYEHSYPFAWLGVLAAAAPYSSELVYAVHPRGFALQSMRSPVLSRLYLQVPQDECIDERSEDSLWRELDARLFSCTGGQLNRGPILERTLVAMRASLLEPLSCAGLFLVGDAGHIVPPSAAKGLNLALADARLLSDSLASWYRSGRGACLDAYSPLAVKRAWCAQAFSASATRLMHVFPGESTFDRQLRRTRLNQLASNNSRAQAFAEQYVGLLRG